MKRIVVLGLTLILAACGGRVGRMDAAVDRAEHWRLQARIAVSDGSDGGSGHLTWEQDGRYFQIELRAPVSGQSWRLSGDDAMVSLEGLRPEPLIAESAEQLLTRELGWQLPVAELTRWLAGVPGVGADQIERDDTGQLLSFRESGWVIRFREMRDGRPVRIEARKPPHQVRVAIQSWVALP